jgi:hypothetical protein
MPEDKRDAASLLQGIDALWDATWAAVSTLADDALLTSGDGDGARAKDVLAHLARWEDWHHGAISEHLADGSTRSYNGYNDWNAAWAAEDAALSPAEARERLCAAHARLRRLLAGLDDAQWDEAVLAFAAQPTLNHYPLHLGALAERAS